MNIGILLPGFSSTPDDWAIPVQLNLVREMALHDDIRVLALRYPHRRDIYPVAGATVYSLGAGQARGAGRLKLWWYALQMLRRLHREKPFDVLHAMWADETGLLAVWAGKWLRIPVVVSVAGGELVGFDDINYGLQRGVFSRWIVGQAVEGATRVVVACSYAKGLIHKQRYTVDEQKIAIIVLGVDTAHFHPPDSRQNSLNKHLIHAASLVGVKDQATLLRAFSRLDANTTLDILGVGPERQHLETLSVELGIRDRVHFLGAVDHLDLPAHYQKADLNVLTSRHEGLGMVTLEAAACGVPTVSTAVGLLPDLPEMGLCTAVGDDAALAQAIERLLHDDELREKLGGSALETARERFTIQHTAAQFHSLYEQII